MRRSALAFFFLMIRGPPRSTQSSSSAASDVYKRQLLDHPDSSVIDFATDIIKEIEIFLTATKKVTVIPSLFFNGFNTFFDSVTSFKKGMMSLKTLLMMVTIENIKKRV